MLTKYSLLLLFLLTAATAVGQIDNRHLENIIATGDSLNEKVIINVQANGFFKNNEYFDSISTGYTLMGSQLWTQLAYVPNPFVRVQAGMFLHKDFGNDTAMKVLPLLTLKIQKNGYSVLFGNLEGNFAHRMIEPLYNYERYITTPIESGLQIKIDRKKIWSDTWMNWEKMQYLGSNFQEQFSVGHHSDIVLYQKQQSKLTLPVQFLVSHSGGQIDVDTTPLKTIANAAIGFTYEYNGESFIKKVRTENFAVFFKDLSPSKRLQYTQGNAVYLNASLTTKYDISASVGYWNGVDFLSSRGGYLFLSEGSQYGARGYKQPNRNLLFFRLLYAHKIFNTIFADVRFEPYYDIGLKSFQYSYSVYFTYKNDFSIFNLAKRK